MKGQIIAIGGSLLIAGTIITASHSASSLKEEGKKESLNSLKAMAVHDSTFELPKSMAKLPALLIKKNQTDEASTPLRMSRVKMDIKVLGNIATTTLDITYCNDLDRLLDGQFCFPLGEGQNISYFALENNGQLQEASVVEKTKGRQTYEAVIRRKVDPALLEWTAGNNFRTRIYPIPAKGCRRVVVKYESELIATGKSNLYYQPIGLSSKLEEFAVHAEVLNQPAQPKQFDEQGIPMKFEAVSENWVMNKTWSNYDADKALAFEIPTARNTRTVFTEKTGNGSTFYLNFSPKKFTAEKKMPSTLTLLWDVSGSGEKRNLKAEINMLDAYLKKVKNAGLKLVCFSNDINSEENFEIREGNTKSLLEKIASLQYDGGTQLGSLKLSNYSCDEFILVSDALHNFGSDDLKQGSTPVHVLCSSPLSDYSFAKGIAQSSGGRFLNLMTTDSASCIEKLCTEDYHFISAEYDANAVSELYPSTPVSFGKTFSMAGKLNNAYSTELRLNFGMGNKVLYTERVTLVNDPHDYGGMLSRIWAEKKVNELDVFYDRNKEEITEIGKKYELVTRNTSLLVLDRLEDYVEHKVVPKDPVLKKQYLASVDRTLRDWKETQKAHLDQVAADFEELKTWYDTDYYAAWLKKKREEAENKRKMALEQTRRDSLRVVNLAAGSVVADSTSLYSWDFSSGEAKKLSEEVVELRSSNTASYNVSITDVNASMAVPSSNGTGSMGWFNGTLASVAFVPPVINDAEQDRDGADISLNAWNPQTPYMTELKKVPAAMAYVKYLVLKKQYSSAPSFFVDVSDYFVKLKDKKNALRILSNIAEMDLENHQLLRVLAHRLQEMNETETAITVFKKIQEIREEEPQSYRDLGLAYAENKQYQKAVDELCKVVNRRWDGRFPQLEAFVASEINNVIAMADAPLNLDSLDKRLVKAMPCDVRVVINWDTDNCDMDLWVTDPEDEKCFYGYRNTQTGGHISNDFTGGYGPETFMIKKALVGKYKVQVNYFGSSQQGLTGPTTVQAELYTNWGRKSQTKKTITLRLKDAAEIIDLGALAFSR